jgi:3-hydroxymyristoyl/3-hydroxydecanoyl-(acyl carrier protein) dehydratase
LHSIADETPERYGMIWMVQNESGQGIGDVQKQICKNQWFFRGFFTFQVMKPARFCKLK